MAVDVGKMFESFGVGAQLGRGERLQEIGQEATVDVPFIDEQAEFMGTETPAGLKTGEKRYDPKKHVELLKSEGFVAEGMKLEADQLAIKDAQTTVEEKSQKLELDSIVRGLDIAKADPEASVEWAQKHGLDVVDIKNMGKGNFEVTTSKGETTTYNYDNTIQARTDANVIFQANQARRLARQKAAAPKELKANEYRLPDGNIINISGLKTAYKMEFDLMDEFDLKLLQRSDPDRYRMEKAKADAAPDFEKWSMEAFDIDLRTKGMSAGLMEALRKKYAHLNLTDHELRLAYDKWKKHNKGQ